MQRIVDSAIHKGTLSPMIIVMPNAEMTYYMNNINGDYQFEDFFIKELIPHIEQNYRCRTEKRYRAIAGLSMGGFGALLYSLHHPTLFSASASLSGAVRTDEQINALSHQQFLRRFQIALGKIKEGEERITDFWNSNSILYLIENMTEEQKNQVQLRQAVQPAILRLPDVPLGQLLQMGQWGKQPILLLGQSYCIVGLKMRHLDLFRFRKLWPKLPL